MSRMPLQTITSQRLYQQAAEQVASMIRAGEYRAGTKLPGERELARLLGVSRPTVRESLIALEIAGLVEVRVGSGAYVKARPATPDVDAGQDPGASPFELVAARKLIEPPIAATAAHTITGPELAALHETLGLIEGSTRDHSERLQIDRLFHTRIAAATHNSVLIEVVDRLWEQMYGPIFALLSERTLLTTKQFMTLSDHRAIYGCIERRDAAAAHAAMLAHLVNVELTLMEYDDLADADEPHRAAPRELKETR